MKRVSEEEKKYVLDVLKNEFEASKNNIYNTKLEKEFAHRFNMKYAIGHVNGTATMHTALAALGVKAGDEVIVPPLTMASTSLAVLHNQSIPVFADVDKQTFNIDADSIEKVITSKTKAIITVALYGLSPDYDKILDICKKYNLFLIEDNAECFLGKYKGKYVGEFGDFSSYSFQASKHITSGEGGILLTNNLDLADKARKFSGLGYSGISGKKGKITKDDIQDPAYCRHVSLGYNYRPSEVVAAVAFGQLKKIDKLVNIRIKVAEIFDEVVLNSELLIRQEQPEQYINSYWCYSVLLNSSKPEKDWYKFRQLFLDNGGDRYYAAWKLTYLEDLFINEIQNYMGVWQKYKVGLCPVSEYLQSRMIQFKTNYWNIDDAYNQAEILDKTIKKYKKLL